MRYHTITTDKQGFTLIEVLMTVVIIGILATVAMRSVQSGIDSSRIRATQDEMDQLAWSIAGNPDLYANGMRSDFGYIGDVGALPSSLDDLVTNPGGYATWNGPYVSRRFTQDTDGYKKDSWGNTYTLVSGITVTSTGGGATTMTKSVASAAADLTSTPINGTITDAAGNPPGDSAAAVTVTVTYPDGVGGITTASANPASGGSFSFTGIPVGIRSVEAVYRATDDTVTAYASVLPKMGAVVALRLPNAPFAGGGGGGGGGGSSLVYVAGTAQSTGAQNDDIQFDVRNDGAASADIDWMIAVYITDGYYRYVKWNATTVFNEMSPRAASGDTASFTASQTLGAGATVTIYIEQFKDTDSGGPAEDMSNTDFTITFSDGTVINFNTGP